MMRNDFRKEWLLIAIGVLVGIAAAAASTVLVHPNATLPARRIEKAAGHRAGAGRADLARPIANNPSR